MHAQDLRFANGHTLFHALRILLEGDTFVALTRGETGPLDDASAAIGGLTPFARYAYMDTATRNLEFARTLQVAARKVEIGSALEPNRRRVDPRRFASQVVELRVWSDTYGVPYDFFANEALEYVARRSTLRTPHLNDVDKADVLDYVLQRWNDPAVRSTYPLQVARWDRRFQHKRKAGSPEHQALYSVIQQRVEDAALAGGNPAEALQPFLGQILPISEAAARFSPALIDSAQQPAPLSLAGAPATDALPSTPPGPNKHRPLQGRKQAALEWARSTCPEEVARLARKELARRSNVPTSTPHPREKSPQQQEEARARMLDLARAKGTPDPDKRRVAIDGWVRTWITAEALQAEPVLATTAWAGYQHLSPLERTELFHRAYIGVYREMHTRHIDSEAGPRKRPAQERFGRNGLQVIRCLWKARALADALGLPYDMFLRAVIEGKVRNGKWTHAARPNQLFMDLDLARARGLTESEAIPDAELVTTDRPGCFGYPNEGNRSRCVACPQRTECKGHVERTTEHIRMTTGSDDPKLQRKRKQDAKRSKRYRANKKKRRE